MEFPHEIYFKNIRNSYAKVNHNGIVIFTISKYREGDSIFLDNFLKRGEKLYIRYLQTTKIQCKDKEGVMIFGERINWIDFFGTGKVYSNMTKEKKLKEILFEYSKDWIDKFSNQLGIPYKSLTIRKMKARRGSCSSNQDIILNIQLVHLPQKYIQYVCAHECAHLLQKDHSDKFRTVTEGLFQNCKKIRKEMKNFILE